MVYLSNAFSLSMHGDNVHCFTETITSNEAVDALTGEGRSGTTALYAKSVIGHTDIANLVSGMLGADVPTCRESITLQPGDVLYVAQYIGPRLPEGTTSLPENARIEWYRVTATGVDLKKFREAAAELFHPENGCLLEITESGVSSVIEFGKTYFPHYFYELCE